MKSIPNILLVLALLISMVAKSQFINKIKKAGDFTAWTKYDFVPGDRLIFVDQLGNEENGEFPSRWDLVKGSAENAVSGNETIIRLTNKSIITPLMDGTNYLPDVFTIEFDAFFDEPKIKTQSYYQRYKIRFWKGDGHYKIPGGGHDFYNPIEIYRNGSIITGKLKDEKKNFRSFDKALDNQDQVWRHIAIAFNKRSLKIYVDQFRAVNIPNLGFKPEMVSIEGFTSSDEGYLRAIKNIRIAGGGKELYDRVATEGKFVTQGILFDVNKATIQPVSMGVLNEVVHMMQEHPEWKFSIEGHTDDDGEVAYNLALSEKRADAVKAVLIKAGIDPDRLSIKGHGENVPIVENTTPEGKAINRRVEFIKL